MNISDLAEDYLVDPIEAMRKLTAAYLNEVLQVEAEKQIQARPYERTGKRRAHRNGTRPRSLKTIHGGPALPAGCISNIHNYPSLIGTSRLRVKMNPARRCKG